MTAMSDSAPRTFLIDGSALAYRSHFARGPGPAFAYANSLLSLVERGRPDYALVAMDTPQPTFRHKAYDAYKATREKTPPELIEKLPLFERIAKCLGFPLYALPGWEADDVIGTLAVRAEAAGHEVYIVTGDKDFLQVVSDKVLIWNPTGPDADEKGLPEREVDEFVDHVAP
jgi:DNA polymerase-1